MHKYGAKAGVLLYVATQLPDIPQVAMIVNEPGESTEDVLKRADGVPILWPRLFRSSAVVELYGYEGDFPTEEIEHITDAQARTRNPSYAGPYRSRREWEEWTRETVDDIRFSPRRMKEESRNMIEAGEKVDMTVFDLPDEINVIVAEKSQSRYFGTYIKHPHQDGFYAIAVTDSYSYNPRMDAQDMRHSTYVYRPEHGAQPFKGWTQGRVKDTPELRQDLTEVVSWHDRIASLPEMDSEWSYQVEFGAEPACLYQVRPFKPLAKANFKVRPMKSMIPMKEDIPPIVIGITPQKGVDIRVEEFGRHEFNNDNHKNLDGQPSMFYGELRQAWRSGELPNRQVTVCTYSAGMLAHNDIKAIRQADLTVLYRLIPREFALKQGEWVNVVSDGINVRYKKLPTQVFPRPE